MGEENNKVKLYAVDKETGQAIELRGIIGTPTINECTIDETIEDEFYIPAESNEIELELKTKKITKKRFIKLLMGIKIQKREAEKMHKQYMEKNKKRTELGLIFFNEFLNHLKEN